MCCNKEPVVNTVCVCRSWSPDRTLAQARKYIADSMGERYADAVLLDLEATWAESDIRTPLVCFLSMGSDPTNQIEGLAKKLHIGKLLDSTTSHQSYKFISDKLQAPVSSNK